MVLSRRRAASRGCGRGRDCSSAGRSCPRLPRPARGSSPAARGERHLFGLGTPSVSRSMSFPTLSASWFVVRGFGRALQGCSAFQAAEEHPLIGVVEPGRASCRRLPPRSGLRPDRTSRRDRPGSSWCGSSIRSTRSPTVVQLAARVLKASSDPRPVPSGSPAGPWCLGSWRPSAWRCRPSVGVSGCDPRASASRSARRCPEGSPRSPWYRWEWGVACQPPSRRPVWTRRRSARPSRQGRSSRRSG